MICHKLIPCIALLLSAVQLAGSEIKVITVDINHLFTNYHTTKKEMEVLKSEQATYLKEREERQKSIDEISEKIKVVIGKLRNKAMPKTERDNLLQEYQELVSQYSALNKDFQESDKDKLDETHEKIAIVRRNGLNEIKKVIAQYAKDHGYHWVMESSGVSNTQISPLVYARNADDKTDEILAILNQDAPKEEKEEADGSGE